MHAYALDGRLWRAVLAAVEHLTLLLVVCNRWACAPAAGSCRVGNTAGHSPLLCGVFCPFRLVADGGHFVLKERATSPGPGPLLIFCELSMQTRNRLQILLSNVSHPSQGLRKLPCRRALETESRDKLFDQLACNHIVDTSDALLLKPCSSCGQRLNNL